MKFTKLFGTVGAFLLLSAGALAGTLKVGADGIALGTKGGKITANATTTVEVDGVKGLGAYVENGGSISNNFDIKVKSAEGIGMYAKGGALASVAKVSELKGNKSKLTIKLIN